MLFRGIFLVFFGIGIFILMQVFSPLLAFKAWEILSYDSAQLLADPQSLSGHSGGANTSSAQVLGISISNSGNFPAFVSTNSKAPPYPDYNLTIPKLKLYDIKVNVFSNNFDETLAQLPGTALPGERGNVFISGHSSIAQNFELKNQKAIFAKLPSLKKGDEVELFAVGQSYIYQVIGMRIVDPFDVQVINPPDGEGRYLTLMTCVPPGFNTKRLIVLAKLKAV